MSSQDALLKLNHVDGFNPLDYARVLPSDIEGQPQRMYLDVKYRVVWFRLVYPKGKINTCIASMDEKMAVVECRIYMDASDQPDAYLAIGYGQRHYDPETSYGIRYLECAETAAIGRALSAAGFNIPFGNDDEEGEAGLIVDSGIQITPPVVTAPPQHYPVQNHGTMAHHNQSPVNASQSHSQPVVPDNGASSAMSVDDAKSVIIPFRGKNNGKTLGQVAVEDPGTLDWIVSKYTGPDDKLRNAARLLIDAAA